jgi:hypothetical protein
MRARFRPALAFDRPRQIAVFAIGIGGVSAIMIALASAMGWCGVRTRLSRFAFRWISPRDAGRDRRRAAAAASSRPPRSCC